MSDQNETVTDGVSRRQVLQEQARAALITGASYSAAAAAAGVSTRTIARWMTDPAFVRTVSTGRGEVVSLVTGRLVNLGDRAVRVLADAMDSDSTAERVRAAQVVLTWTAKLRRDVDLATEIAELRAAVGLDQPVATGDENEE